MDLDNTNECMNEQWKKAVVYWGGVRRVGGKIANKC